MNRRRATALRALAALNRGERCIYAAARRAFRALSAYITSTLAGNADPSRLDTRAPAWRAAVDADLVPSIERVFIDAFNRTSDGRALDARDYATRHIEAVYDRLVGTADEVFDSLRLTLQEGREAGEGIPELTERVEEHLSAEDTWDGRARTIARTEVVGANNAGSDDAAGAVADVLGIDRGDVVKDWLATRDTRTRPTHAAANGQQVRGLATPFTVGGAPLLRPGDVAGPPAETINCRCVALYLMPGDPNYPDTLNPGDGVPDAVPSIDSVAAAAAVEQEDGMAENEDERGTCTCCALSAAGPGEHEDGHECYVCDSAGTLDAQREADSGVVDGEPILCAGHHGRTEPEEGREHTPDTDETDTAPDGTPVAGEDDDTEEQDEMSTTAASGVLDAFAALIARESGRPLAAVRASLDRTYAEVSGLTADAGDPAPTIRIQEADAGDPAPALIGGDADLGDQFHGVAVIEDEQTGDGRVMLPASLYWDDTLMPLPLGWQVADAPGHDGSVIVGRIDRFERVGNEVWYEGTWDVEGAGWEARRMVEGLFLRGISVDLDDVDATVVSEEGESLDGFDAMFMDGDDLLVAVSKGRIRSSALCRVPAFAGAFIANGPRTADSAPPEDAVAPEESVAASALVAAATRAALPPRALAPAAHFSDPGLTQATPVTITDDGRIFGHLAAWGTCHIGMEGSCVTPPVSAASYAYFLTGEVATDAGSTPVGQITIDTGHAAPHLRAAAATAHYDHTGSVVADVTCGEDAHGIWLAGRVRDEAPVGHVEALRRGGALSGDWRRIGGNLELVAALAVNVPGFPVPRLGLAASGSVQTALVAAGYVPPTTGTLDAPMDTAVIAAAVVATLDRRARAQAASARIRRHRVAAAAARLTR